MSRGSKNGNSIPCDELGARERTMYSDPEIVSIRMFHKYKHTA